MDPAMTPQIPYQPQAMAPPQYPTNGAVAMAPQYQQPQYNNPQVIPFPGQYSAPATQQAAPTPQGYQQTGADSSNITNRLLDLLIQRNTPTQSPAQAQPSAQPQQADYTLPYPVPGSTPTSQVGPQTYQSPLSFGPPSSDTNRQTVAAQIAANAQGNQQQQQQVEQLQQIQQYIGYLENTVKALTAGLQNSQETLNQADRVIDYLATFVLGETALQEFSQIQDLVILAFAEILFDPQKCAEYYLSLDPPQTQQQFPQQPLQQQPLQPQQPLQQQSPPAFQRPNFPAPPQQNGGRPDSDPIATFYANDPYMAKQIAALRSPQLVF